MFLNDFKISDTYMMLCIGNPDSQANYKFYKEMPNIDNIVFNNKDKPIYFGMAQRLNNDATKNGVVATNFLWVDVDNSIEYPHVLLPATYSVFSGHGWHLYYKLNKTLYGASLIEEANKKLLQAVQNPDMSCWNCNRIFRVPNSINYKYPDKPVSVELRYSTDAEYSIEEINNIFIPTKILFNKINSESTVGFKSRSEKDFSVVSNLVKNGFTYELIERIFKHLPVGIKYRDRSTSNTYLETTYKKAAETLASKEKKQQTNNINEIVEQEDGYYIAGKYKKRISTFILKPQYLITGDNPFLICEVYTENSYTSHVAIPKSAFTSVQKLDKELKNIQWQWLGNESELRLLLPYILTKLDASKTIESTDVLGLQKHNDSWVYVGNNQVMKHDGLVDMLESGVYFIPKSDKVPNVNINPDIDTKDLELLKNTLYNINNPDVIKLLIGWYTAAIIKPYLEAKKIRFPILNIAGTKGSGKTSLIKRIFMPLFGQPEPAIYDAGTTKFIVLTLLGTNTSVPIAFSEFRLSQVNYFLRYVLLSYDNGHDARGKQDQTTVNYPLISPFSVDGEDIINDPACQERLVLAIIKPMYAEENSDTSQNFYTIAENLPSNFFGYLLQKILVMINDGTIDTLILKAKKDIKTKFKSNLPDRIRNNHMVDLLGMYIFCTALELDLPEPTYLKYSIAQLTNMDSGRSKTHADDMVEQVINTLSRTQSVDFNYIYSDVDNILYVQLATTYLWYKRQQRTYSSTTLEREALRNQLEETPYLAEPENINGIYYYAIDITKASKYLDIPNKLNITLRIKKHDVS